MKGCLVVTHGEVGSAIVEAGERIAGRCEQLFALKTANLTPRQIHEKIVKLIDTEDVSDGLFILVCLRGGSFWNRAARVAKEFGNVQVISGLNLSMILSFITKHKSYSFTELGDIIINDGSRGISKL